MYEQARKAIWEAINPHSGKRRIDEAFPKELRSRTDNQSMTIEFKIGSIWKVVGSDNPDSLVGAPPAGIVFSEWALANPSAWGYLAPILAENEGWADFITTPRGRNHVKTMLDMARISPSWFAEVLTPKQTGFSLELVEEQRREYHSIFGQDVGDALIDQEYWCSFEAAILGAYYGREMMEAEQDGRITNIEPDLHAPVHTAWDLGVKDSTAIWWFQIIGPYINVIDYYEAANKGAVHYCDIVKNRGYFTEESISFVPHDAKVKEWASDAHQDGTPKQRIEVLLALGMNPKLVPSHRIEDGINAARQSLPKTRFDGKRCEKGIECLRQYRREWDNEKKVFKKTPLHDWASDGADAFRYLAMAWRTPQVEQPKERGRILSVGPLNEVTLEDVFEANEAKQPRARRI